MSYRFQVIRGQVHGERDFLGKALVTAKHRPELAATSNLRCKRERDATNIAMHGQRFCFSREPGVLANCVVKVLREKTLEFESSLTAHDAGI